MSKEANPVRLWTMRQEPSPDDPTLLVAVPKTIDVYNFDVYVENLAGIRHRRITGGKRSGEDEFTWVGESRFAALSMEHVPILLEADIEGRLNLSIRWVGEFVNRTGRRQFIVENLDMTAVDLGRPKTEGG